MKLSKEFGLLEIIHLAILVFTYGLFFLFSLDTFKEYQEEKTGINQYSTSVKELPLPTITICSQNVFKNIEEDSIPLQNISAHVYSR